MSVVDGMRFVAMGALAVALLTGVESIALLVIVSFALGMAETVFDNASQAILPSLVADDALETANGRLEGAEIVANQFVGPPLGAWLFGLAASAPFFLDAGSFAFAARAGAHAARLVPTRARRSRAPRCAPTSPRACAGSFGTACCARSPSRSGSSTSSASPR